MYSNQCGEVDCDEEYKGETSRTLGEMYKEHLKEPSPIHVHSQQTGHITNPDNFNISSRVDQGLTRLIKESIYIRVKNPPLIGIWVSSTLVTYGKKSTVLLNNPDLSLGNNRSQMQAQSNKPLQLIPP